MPTRLKQGLVAAIGFALAAVMLWLGLWQMRVYEAKEQDSAEQRAALAPVALLESPVDTMGDLYGRQVTVSGSYLPTQEIVLIDGRVLTAFEVTGGSVLPVVRGTTIPEPADGPSPVEVSPSPAPAGEQEVVGVFLPSEARSDQPDGSVRLAALAQQWPQQLLPGFVTLGADAARAQGLQPATVVLTTGDGSWQNYGYALQWWVFAGFAIFMTLRFVRAIGRQGVPTLAEPPDPT
jgi:cytochrome oxidase assembly protein ShyY1